MASYEYDEVGRRTKVTDPLGNYSETVYDDEGRVSDTKTYGYATSDAQSVTLLSHVNYAFDTAGRTIQVNRKVFIPDGVSTERSIYLQNGSLTQSGGMGENDVPETGTWIAGRTEYDRLGRGSGPKLVEKGGMPILWIHMLSGLLFEVN